MKYLSVFLLFGINSLFAIISLDQHIFVGDKSSNTVEIIDIVNQSAEEIFGFQNPRVVKLTQDRTQAWVGEDAGHVRVIDTHTNTVLPIVFDIPKPVAMAITHNDKFIYVVNSNSITVIDIKAESIVTTITGFKNLQDIKILPDDSFAYVTDADLGTNGTVCIIRLSDNTLTGTITGIMSPKGITLTNDGGLAYVTDTTHSLVYVIRTSDNTIIDQVLGFETPQYMVMTPDDEYFFITNNEISSVMKVRISDNQILQNLRVPKPGPLALSRNGNHLLVGSQNGALYQYSTIDFSTEAIYPGYGIPSNLAPGVITNPPKNSFAGCQFITYTPSPVVTNRLTWQPSPDSPSQYRIFRDTTYTDLVATLSPSTFEFDDTNLVLGQTYNYYLLTDYPNGFSTSSGAVNVDPARICIGNE